jgi:hypothetical protein
MKDEDSYESPGQDTCLIKNYSCQHTATVIEQCSQTTENIVLRIHIAGTKIYPSKNHFRRKDRKKDQLADNTHDSETS